ncbi:hypothetical protein HGRIS_005191 [Hohenbuehelia grisea]|uniref:Major facilitator superfamily (MFS) profile domain-containing protein n=1 Tax=Hohenbuehelia grisea TaxID=104357 RepID=A0ABR3JER8_9AGAR
MTSHEAATPKTHASELQEDSKRTSMTVDESGTHEDRGTPSASDRTGVDEKKQSKVIERSRTENADEDEDVLIVDWDGADDPMNPKNWSYKKKWAATIVVSSFTFISPVSSSMIAPATGRLAEDFGITSSVVMALATSVFVLAYAFGPLVLGPLSEIFGRSRVLQLANLFYLVWNLACGFAQNTGQLIAFRFLAGLGGSAPLAAGGGVLSDIWAPEERGRAIAIYSLAPLLGPVLGPIAGAWVGEKSTWRWVFWSTSIVCVAVQISGLFFLRETYAPILLGQKAARIRKELLQDPEKGRGRVVKTIYDTDDRHWKTIMTRSLVRPFALFFREPIVQILGVYMAFIYGVFYLFLTTMPSIFEGVYKMPVGTAGLNYLALGVGLSGASQFNARAMDKIYIHLKRKNNGEGKPEFRLPPMIPGTILLPIGLFLTGWSAQKHVHWIVPDIGIAFIGAGMILTFQSIQIYVVDAFGLYAASALAAVSFLRSIAGFGFPLFAPTMYKHLGFGKGDSILGALAIIFGCPAPFIFWKYGERIRLSSRYARRPPVSK